MCAMSRSKVQRHRENETHFCGRGCRCNLATVRLGDLRSDMNAHSDILSAIAQIVGEEWLEEFFRPDANAAPLCE
jgi:hypothetical protein